MKSLIPLLTTLTLLTATIIIHAQGTIATNTLAISGAIFNNGSTLNGTFTYSYDTNYNSIVALLSADITLGTGTNVPGLEYLFNLPGQTDTASPTPHLGSPSGPPSGAPILGADNLNVRFLYSASDSSGIGLALYLHPIAFDGGLISDSTGNLAGFVGNPIGFTQHAGAESAYGTLGTITTTPEPSTLALASLGLAGWLALHRRK